VLVYTDVRKAFGRIGTARLIRYRGRHSSPGEHPIMRRTPLFLSSLLMLTGLCSNTSFAQMSMLHANGRSIVNADGTVVPLTGVNLGGWFVMEKWMTPLDSGSLPDTYSVMQKLDSRFGVETEQSLIKTFQQSWITTADLDNIKNAGFNVVRAPIWWGQFYLLNNHTPSGWRADAFEVLDWLVNACAARGIYVIIDMHGVVGGQSMSDDTGRSGQNQYWTNRDFQGDTAYLWWQIANHYKGNPTVAAFDLINEPIGTPSSDTVLNLYNELYQSIRSVDPSHMIIMEGTWGNWNWSMLPNPNVFGWTNVAYQMHEYQWNAPQSQVEQGAVNQVNDFNNHASYNVPDGRTRQPPDSFRTAGASTILITGPSHPISPPTPPRRLPPTGSSGPPLRRSASTRRSA
jgi:endoglucanase